MTDSEYVIVSSNTQSSITAYHDPHPEDPTKPLCETELLVSQSSWRRRDPNVLADRFHHCSRCRSMAEFGQRRVPDQSDTGGECPLCGQVYTHSLAYHLPCEGEEA